MQITKQSSTLLINFLLLACITLAVFYPAIHHQFVNFDDNRYITENPHIRNLSADHIKSIFLTSNLGQYQYHPLTILSFALEYQIAGLNPLIYHLDNLILHLLNTLLVYFFIYQMCSKHQVAFLTALLFGIHPMHVESVVWATERKDVLYTFFYMISLNFYIRYVKFDQRKIKYLIMTFLSFTLSLLSKPSAFTLPFVLILLDMYFKVPFKTKRNLLSKLPFFTLTFIFIWITRFNISYIHLGHDYSLLDKFFLSFYIAWIYLVKIFLPFDLSCYYPLPQKTNQLLPVFIYTVPLIFSFVIYFSRHFIRQNSIILFGLLFFFINISYVFVFLQYEKYLYADRYSYVSYIGLFFILSSLIETHIIQQNHFKIMGIIAAAVIILNLGLLTRQRINVWKNDLTLFSDLIEKSPKEPLGYNNRGLYWARNNEWPKALDDFNKAVELNENYYLGYLNRATAYMELKNYTQSLKDYNKALSLQFDMRIIRNRNILLNKMREN